VNLNTTFTRIYTFTSAHRLHTPHLDNTGNTDVYEKCNNPRGHGHDYRLEVSIKGEPDPQTGMVIPMDQFDIKVKMVLDQLDYKHLNKEVDFFKENISTGEIIIQYLWQELNRHFSDTVLYHLKLWETNNNYFELCGNY
jgi:6-pyruvoyltetrahydropterin/6-carboxytetrahydropterin synthase